MDKVKVKTGLETAINIAILLAAVAALAIFVANMFIKKPSPNLRLGLEKGKQLAPVPNIDYGSSTETLLIAMSTNCLYCRESLSFYRQLIETNSRSNSGVHIVALFPNNEKEAVDYVQQNQMNVDIVASVNFSPLKIAGTPTMILVNKNGDVKDFWVGKLSSNEEQKLVDALAAAKL